MKKIAALFVTAFLVLGNAAAAFAGIFDIYYDYENEDGSYSYYFDQGLTVKMDRDWYQKTLVRIGDRGATFYHKASYKKYAEKGMEGGRLFTIGASVNSSFSELPSFEYIGFNEKDAMNYYAELPTDYQGFEADPAVKEEYNELWKDVRTVIANIRIDGQNTESQNKESQNKESQNTENLNTGSQNTGAVNTEPSLFRREFYDDDFSWEIPSDWTSWTQEDPDTIFASKDGMNTSPFMCVQEVHDGIAAGDYVILLKNRFLEQYGSDVVKEPEIITFEPEGTSRKIAGYTGVYSPADEDREYTVTECVEYFGDDLYHYSCSYVSDTAVEGEHEDETTAIAFRHAVESMMADF